MILCCRLFIVGFSIGLTAASAFAQYGPPPEVAINPPFSRIEPIVTDDALGLNRDDLAKNYPSEMKDMDFFGRARKPSIDFSDPFLSAITKDGRPIRPGDSGVITENARYIEFTPFAWPEISVAEETWVTLVLMREGEIVQPNMFVTGSDKIIRIQKSPIAESPYLYLRAVDGRTSFKGAPLRTTLDIEVKDKDGQIYNIKFKVNVVPITDTTFSPTVKANMVNATLPPMHGSASRPTNEIPGTNPSALIEQKATQSGGWNGAYSEFKRFSREDVRKYFPIMIGMAKAYDAAKAAGARGYSSKEIQRFQPATVIGRQIVSDRIAAFKNPADGQVYFCYRGFAFPKYDAILYEVSFKNQSTQTLWWNYSLLGVIPGFEGAHAAVAPRAVSPEYGETTPPGKINTLWVLVQGLGWRPSTPIRFAFPSVGMEGTIPSIVQPHIATPPPPSTTAGSLLSVQ